MIVPFNSTTGWVIQGDTANLALNTTTFKSGGGSIEFDKTGTTQTYANLYRYVSTPIDIAAMRARNYTLSYWVHHANFTDFAYVSLILAYECPVLSSPATVADRYIDSTLSAGWNKVSMALASPTSTSGTAAELAAGRARGPKLIFLQGNMNAAANTFADLKWDALMLEGDPGCSLFVFGSDDGARVMLDAPLTPWNRTLHAVSHINAAEQAVETIFQTSEERIRASMPNIRSIAQREGLRRWAQYASRNNDWGIARDSRYLLSTTIDAASGYSETDPSVLNVADTTEASFIIDDLGKECWVAVLSLANRTVEVARVLSISAGVSLTLYTPLRNDYVSGDKVVSALADGNPNYLPAAALLNPNPITETGRGVDLDIEARWAT